MIKKSTIILVFCFSLLTCNNYKSIRHIPRNTARILFIGNSITYSGHYINYLETYFTIKYPKRCFEFINVGLSSETVSGLSEPNHANGKFPRPDLHDRLERIIAKTKPDLVLACYGMNDGIYLPFDEERFQKFKDGILWLHQEFENINIPIVHLTPPIYDERKGAEYAQVLDIYSNWLLDLKKTANWKIVDLHGPMKAFLASKRKTDDTFELSKDGIHPNPIGHWVMAQQLLSYFGCTNVNQFDTPQEAISTLPHGMEILKLVEKRQDIMKHAWLTYTGYKRPGIKEGLPMEEAKLKYAKIQEEINEILNKRS